MDNINKDMARMVAEMREVGELPAPSKGGSHNNLLRYNEMRERILEKFLSAFDAGYTLTPPNEPLTQADLDKMHFDRVWIDYGVSDDGEREGEDGVVLYGKLYSIDTLDGSAFEDLLLDATGHGDTLDNPSGNYTVYRRPPEGEA